METTSGEFHKLSLRENTREMCELTRLTVLSGHYCVVTKGHSESIGGVCKVPVVTDARDVTGPSNYVVKPMGLHAKPITKSARKATFFAEKTG